MANALQIQRQSQGGVTRVALVGEITEQADFGELTSLGGQVVFDLGGIKRVNSFGAREWVQFIRALSARAQLSYERCPPAIITQANMLANFLPGGRVLTFSAPYYCQSCECPTDVLLDVARDFPDRQLKAPERNCEKCSSRMDFDDVEESYLAFLR